MTLLRTLAYKLQEFVVTNASPGSKEWAEALAREADFIQNDWTALVWSLGSLRVLFDYRPTPIRSMDDLLVAAKKFTDSKLRKNGTWNGIMFAQALIFTDKYFRVTTGQQRLGCILGVIGTVLLGALTLRQWHRQKVSEGLENTNLIQRYKEELQRVRNLPRTLAFWGLALGFVLQCLGIVFSERGGAHAHPIWAWICSALAILVTFLFFQTQRNNRRQLEQVEALLSESN